MCKDNNKRENPKIGFKSAYFEDGCGNVKYSNALFVQICIKQDKK